MEKVCNKCGNKKSLSEFNKCKSKKDGHQNYCAECNKLNLKEHYQDNKEYYSDKKDKQKLTIKDYINEIKEVSKCSRCPEDDIACLDFHHEGNDIKEFNLADAITNGYSIDKIKKEIEKCIVLCSNCHRKLHFYKN